MILSDVDFGYYVIIWNELLNCINKRNGHFYCVNHIVTITLVH